MIVDSVCINRLPSLKFTFTFGIIRPGELDLWPFGHEPVTHYYTPGGQGNLPPILVFLGRFVLDLSANTCQTPHVTNATLIFDLGGHGACRWCGFSYSARIPSLKFVGLPVRKIWRTSSLSISRPGDTDLGSLTLKLVRIIACRVYNLPINFGVSVTFHSRLIGQHLPDASRDIATLTLTLEVMAPVDDVDLRAPSVYQVWSS